MLDWVHFVKMSFVFLPCPQRGNGVLFLVQLIVCAFACLDVLNVKGNLLSRIVSN